MTATRLTPAVEFHLALLDDAALNIAGTVHPQYLMDLYPIGDRTDEDYAAVILGHVHGWLGFNLHSHRGTRTQLEPDGRDLIYTHLEVVTQYLRSHNLSMKYIGNDPIRLMIQKTLQTQYRMVAGQAADLAGAFTSLMWLKLAVYGDDVGVEKVALASRLWQEMTIS